MADESLQLLGRLGFDVDGEGKLKAFDKNLQKTARRMDYAAKQTGKLAARFNHLVSAAKFAGAALVGSRIFRYFTTDVADNVTQLDKWSKSIGVSVDRMQRLQYVARSQKTEVEELHDVMHTFTERVNDAFGPDASKDAQGMLKQLGLTKDVLTDQNGQLKGTYELLLIMSDAFKGVKNEAQRAALLDTVLGDAGRRVVNVLLQGREGIERLSAEAEAKGQVLDEKTIKATLAYQKAKERVKTALLGVRNAIAQRLLPAAGRWLRTVGNWLESGDNLQKLLARLKVAAVAVGVALAFRGIAKGVEQLGGLVGALRETYKALRMVEGAALAANAKVYLIAAAVGAIYLVVDDLYTFATGGKSVLGDLLGDTEQADKVRSALLEIGGALQDAWGQLAPVLAEAASQLLPIFGLLWTDIIKPMLPYLVTGLTYLIRGFAKWATWVTKLISYAIVKPLKWLFPYLAAGLRWWVKLMTKLWNGSVGKMIRWLFDALQDGIQAVMPAIEWMADKIGWLLDKIGGTIGWVFDKLEKAIAWFEGKFGPVFKMIADNLKAAWDAVTESIRQAYKWTKKLIEDSSKKVGDAAFWSADEFLGGSKKQGATIGATSDAVARRAQSVAMRQYFATSRNANAKIAKIDNMVIKVNKPFGGDEKKLAKYVGDAATAALMNMTTVLAEDRKGSAE